MPSRSLFLAVTLLATSAAVAQQPGPVGLYRAQAGPDTASLLELTADGHFRYQLSEGALDEWAQGRWTATPQGAELETQPHPKAPTFTLGEIGTVQEAAFALRVTVPGGDGVAGVDFRLGFTNGETMTGYTQQDGWSLAPSDTRQPAWIEVYEPIHDFASPRFALPARKHMAVTLILTPNDIGVADFTHSALSLTDDGVVLHWRDRDIPYRRISSQEFDPQDPEQ